jgi:hypothetical protein
MICLGRKYEFSALYNEALRRLKLHFPSSLIDGKNSVEKTPLGLVPTKAPEIDVVNLAYENNVHAVLPAALLGICLRYPLVSGWFAAQG